MSRVYRLHTHQKIPTSLEKAWDFFSQPGNLKRITPTALNFQIQNEHPLLMYPGQIIEYTVKPLLGIPIYWMTEITHVEFQKRFVDEQRVGPYRLWHHQHQFTSIPEGVEMTDVVHYQLPFGFLGDVVNALIVRRQLQTIFDFRQQAVEEIFGKWRE